MCRSNLGYPEMFERYNYIYDKNTSLDRLEDYWISKEFRMASFCSFGKHYLGMKKKCSNCINYRNTGEFS